jgi:hypothetical protein
MVASHSSYSRCRLLREIAYEYSAVAFYARDSFQITSHNSRLIFLQESVCSVGGGGGGFLLGANESTAVVAYVGF